MNTTATSRRLCLHQARPAIALDATPRQKLVRAATPPYLCVETAGHAMPHRSLQGVTWAPGFAPAVTRAERFDLETELELEALEVPAEYRDAFRARRRASVAYAGAQLADAWEKLAAGAVGGLVKLLERKP